jgi:AraC-like DNA-binding protein
MFWREAGAESLLSVGQGIRTVEYDPIWHAAVRSASPGYLFEKWRRFEAFGHSINRLRIDQAAERLASFQRYTVDGGTPTAPENLLICGLIIALLEQIGCRGLVCEMALENGTSFRVREDGRFRIPGGPGTLVTNAWSIEWRSFTPRAENATVEAELPRLTLPRSSDPSLRESIEAVVRILMQDVARQWKVAELAREVGLSARSLQRRLGDAELSFSRLVRLVRIHEACRLLKDSDASITAIGFCAGFSDSAHFSRDFRASMGLSPSDYRAV